MANIVYNQYTNSLPDGSTLQNDLTGAAGEKLVAQAHGSYYNLARRGAVFSGSTAAAGTAFPATNATAITFGLWNSSTDHNAEILRYAANYTSGTIALGQFAYTFVNAGYAIGTAAPISAFTAGTPQPTKLGSPVSSCMKFTPSAATLTTAGTVLEYNGFGTQSATAGNGIFYTVDDIYGRIIVPPGYFFYITGSIAQTALFTMSLTWAEVPV